MDYEFVAKSVAAKKVFGHHFRHHFNEKARDWATEQFGPEAAVSRVESAESESLKMFFSGRYVFDDVGTWAYVSGDFYFRDVDQAFAFKMRWL